MSSYQKLFRTLKKTNTIGVFLDLPKAFDTIVHNTLIFKINHYGIRGLALDCFSSYCKDRKQCTFLTETRSQKEMVTCVVPHSSVIGPLLFIIYVNDMSNCLSSATAIIFAEDSTIYKSQIKLNDLFTVVNRDLDYCYSGSRLMPCV